MELDFSRETLEKLLFKQILTDKQYMNVISENFDKRWFKVSNMDLIFNLSIKFFKKFGKIPNSKIVKSLVKGYIEKRNRNDLNFIEINELIDSSLGLEINLDKEILEKYLNSFIRKQALYTSIMDNIEDIENNSDDVLEKCITRFDDVSKMTFMQKDLGMDYSNQDDMDKHWKYISNPEARIPFLWDTFDKYTNGGVFKGGRFLGIFMGQAGLGKSLFLSNLAVNYLKQNLKVVVISLEMSQDVYAQRFDAHISMNNINHLKDTMDESYNRIKDFFKKYPESKLYIKEYPPRSVRISDIEMYLDNLITAGKTFDVIIIDYLNLVLPNHSKENMYQDILEVAEKMRGLSYKYNVPIWTGTQTNSNGINNENVALEHVSESKGQIHTADFFVGLFQMPEDRENGIINVRVLKNRLGGQIGKVIPMKVNDENLVLSDIGMDPTGMNDFIKTSEEQIAENIIANASNISADINGL